MQLLEDARRQQRESGRVLSASSPLAPRGARVRNFIEIDPKAWEKTVMLRQALRERLAAFVRVTSPESRTTAINFLLAVRSVHLASIVTMHLTTSYNRRRASRKIRTTMGALARRISWWRRCKSKAHPKRSSLQFQVTLG